MKLREYKDSLHQIKVPSERKEELWTELIHRESEHPEKEKHNSLKAPFRIAIGTAVIFCIFFVMNSSVTMAEHSSGGIIEQVREFFHGFLTSQDNAIMNQEHYNMTDMVEKNIYCDENSHVRMEVLEQLSDGMTVLLTVRYTGLDEKGIQWILTNTENGFLEENSWIMPVFPNDDTEKYGVNYSTEIKHLPEMDTETERYFYVRMQASSMEYSSDKVVFRYRMPEDGEHFLIPSPKETELDAGSEQLDFVVYEIADNGEHPYCELRYLYISGLSYIIYGRVKEDYNLEDREAWWSLSDIGLLYEEDGIQKLLIDTDSFTQNVIPKEENRYSDIVCRSGSFHESEKYTIMKIIDPDSVSKLVFFDANGEHICDLIKLEEE